MGSIVRFAAVLILLCCIYVRSAAQLGAGGPPQAPSAVMSGGTRDLTLLTDAHPGRPSLPPVNPRIQSYNRTWYALYFFSSVWEVLGLLLMLRLRIGPRLRDYFKSMTRFPLLEAAGFYAVYSLLLALWHLPLAFYGYTFDREYGFARQSVSLWLVDRGRGYLFGLLSILAVWFGYRLLQWSPKRWWLWLWVGAIPWIVAQSILWPVVVAPMYNRFIPMPEGRLRDRLLDLSRKAGVEGAQVFEVDISRRTTKLNAYVAGIGPTKRIVIWDTTLKELSDDEIVAIIGHELGHYVLSHVWWNALSSCAGAFAILWLLSRILPWAVERWGVRLDIRGLDDLGGLPLVSLVLLVILFLQTPIESAISRYEEHQADRYGLELTGLHEATARAFITFVKRDYADPDPPPFIVFWFYSHPPIRDRVNFALNYGLEGR